MMNCVGRVRFQLNYALGRAASETIDYPDTLGILNKDQIALAGLSLNGEMTLWASASLEV